MINEPTGIGIAFVAGLLASAHCLGMCGGFVMTYGAATDTTRPVWFRHALYAIGKIVSYATIGAAFGLVGNFFGFAPGVRVALAIAAGIYLVVCGLDSLGLPMKWIAPSNTIPAFAANIYRKTGKFRRDPLTVGLASGLLITCGPLQALYIAAAGTGSVLLGAGMLAAFAVGTLPLLLGLGFTTSLSTRRFGLHVRRVTGVVIIILGAMMLNHGISMARNQATCCSAPQEDAASIGAVDSR